MLTLLRRRDLSRLVASALVLGLAVAWAAPARAAVDWEAERERVSRVLESVDEQRVADALVEASRVAGTPEQFAAEVVRALDVSDARPLSAPAADALLRALFGRILQARALGTTPAVAATMLLVEVPLPQAPATPAFVPEASAAPLTASADSGADDGASPPRVERPGVQTLGP